MVGKLGEWLAQRRGEAGLVLRVRACAEAGRAAEARELAARGGGLAAWRALRGALAVGALPPGAVGALPAPRAAEDRLLDALARVRAGEAPATVRAELAAFDARTLPTAGGPRAPARALAVAPLTDRFDRAAPRPGPPRAEARAALRARLQGEGATDDWLRLAELRHPEDLERLLAARGAAGRRADHRLLEALGLHGDPRALPVLREALHARDIDPGRGFVQRRLAADGLGRLGLAAAVPLLRRALRDERADFEGRPGAGLGVQYPVRANLLWALGELGSVEGVPTLIESLGDTAGSAFGGFYLPAMDALLRLGPVAVPALERCARGRDAAAANAAAVLRLLAEGA